MGYPDGDPRFVVREHTGYAIYEGGRQSASERTEIMVLDRAYNHKLIWTSWDNPRVMHLPLHKQRAHAYLVAHTMERQYA